MSPSTEPSSEKRGSSDQTGPEASTSSKPAADADTLTDQLQEMAVHSPATQMEEENLLSEVRV